MSAEWLWQDAVVPHHVRQVRQLDLWFKTSLSGMREPFGERLCYQDTVERILMTS